MTYRPKVVISWSSGKDSAFALFELQRSSTYEIVGILTTITTDYKRVSIHGVRESLLDMQADALGLKVYKVLIPATCSNDVYDREMLKMVTELRSEGVTHVAFGDLFLQDIRTYREKRLEGTGIEPLFPLWQRNTSDLAKTMINSGLKAKITCVDSERLDPRWSGAEFDEKFLQQKPVEVDPCGENGEFHTFVYAAPMFSKTIYVTRGVTLADRNFVFCDFSLE